MRKSIARRARNQRAPYACIEAVEAACNMPFDEGCAFERKLFDELVGSEEARALRYAFFAEREVTKLPHIPAGTQQRPTEKPGVVGAGTMGGGIAMSFADHGFDVRITDATQEALDRGMARIRANYETSVKRGSLAQDEMEKRLARIHPVPGIDDLADCDVIIEAAFEQIPVKEEIFKKLDQVMNPGAILFSNTSGIDIDIMANVTNRPQDVAGTHFFAPANVMRLFEVVQGTKSAPDVIATAMSLGSKIGKVSALAGNTDGFVANRSRAPFGMEMNVMLEEGALPEQVDKVMVDFGYPIGPFATSDLSGLDIGYDTRKRRAQQYPNYRQAADRRPHRRGRTARAEDRRRLVSLRARRPHAASRPGGGADHPRDRRRTRRRTAPVHRRRDPEAPAVRQRQRGLQDPRRGQGAARQRHRRDVAARVRLPALPRRADVLGRHDRGARGL